MAITIVLIHPAWKGTSRLLRQLSPGDMRESTGPILWILGLSLVFLLATPAMGLLGPTMVQKFLLLVASGIGALAVIRITVVLWSRMRRRFPASPRQNWFQDPKAWDKAGALAYFLSALYLAFTALTLTLGVAMSIDTVLGIELTADHARRFEFSRWILKGSVSSFVWGSFGSRSAV